MAQVAIRDVKKTFGAVNVIHGVDLEIKDGEFVVLVGPSGCGKSTLLRIIAGLETVSAGAIQIGDRVVNQPAAGRARHRHGVPGLRALSAQDGSREHGLRVEDARKTEGRDGQRAGQPRRRDSGPARRCLQRYPRQLSGGQRQRVAMGRAIVRNPQVFLLDEPLSNLDAKLRVQMRAEIKELHQRLKTTTIYVTHDQVEAMTMADRIVVMRDGVVEQVGAPLDLYDRPKNTFVAGFIGSPAMNFLKACQRQGAKPGADRDRGESPVPDRRQCHQMSGRPADRVRHPAGASGARERWVARRRSPSSSRPARRPRWWCAVGETEMVALLPRAPQLRAGPDRASAAAASRPGASLRPGIRPPRLIGV